MMAVYEPREVAGGGWRLTLPQKDATYVTLAALEPEHDRGAIRATLVLLQDSAILTKDRVNLTRAVDRTRFIEGVEKQHVTVEERALLALEEACRRTATPRHGRAPDQASGGHAAAPSADDPESEPEGAPAVDVPLTDLLDLIVAFLEGYLVFSSPLQAKTLALWIAHTHVLEAFDITAYLHVQSPQKRSGKTRLLELVEELVPRPWRVVEATAATVFRKIARDAPTLLLDEVDTIWRGVKSSSETAQALRGVLNAGYRRGVSVPRCVGRNFEQLVDFPVFCPKALAGIGTLPDTIADRAVCLVFARKKKRERTARFRFRTIKQETAAPYRGLARWAPGAVDHLREASPPIPEALDDRAAEIWEPLLAIADLAGGQWPAAARQAAVALRGAGGEDESAGVMLLRAIKEIFEHLDTQQPQAGEAELFTGLPPEPVPHILTVDLLVFLVQREAEPWGTWWGADVDKALEKDKHPQGPANKLASLLKPFDIQSQDIRTAGGTRRGYLRASFADAWERYVADPVPEGCDGATTSGAQGFAPSYPPPEAEGGATAETLGGQGASHRRAPEDGKEPSDANEVPSGSTLREPGEEG